MRDIRCRYWHKEDKRFYYSGLVMSSEGKVCVFGGNNECPVVQFTGLKDKDGKEIWEGDILAMKNSTRKAVVFVINDAHAGFNISRWGMRNAIVIGNVFENPELLT